MEHKILIIDGHPVYIHKLDGFLRSLTFKNVSLASSAGEGIEKVRTQQPDLVILSGMLPDAESVEVCKLIKEIHPMVRMIVQVGLFTEKEAVERFIKHGAHSVLPRKEKDLHPLQSSIESLLCLKSSV